MLKKEGLNFEKPRSMIADSANQFSGFGFCPDIETAKGIVLKYNLVTLEEFTGKSTEELNKIKPNLCEKYNALIAELKSLDFSFERLQEIIKEAYKITHGV